MTYDNTVSIQCDGQTLTGFTTFELVEGIDEVPARFSLSVTQNPNTPQFVKLRSGQPMTIKIGSDLVFTGYVGAYGATISGSQHETNVRGDSKFADLMRCSAVVSKPATMYTSSPSIFGSGVIQGQSVGQIATMLAAPFGITVTGDSPVSIPQLNFNMTDTSYAVIAKLARYARLLFYDDYSGNVLLTSVGTQKHSSGFSEGVNVQSSSVTYDQSDEYSDYYVMWQNFNPSTDISANSGFLAHGYASDTTVKRFKPLCIMSDQIVDGIDLGNAVAQWEYQRRLGRSQAVTVTCNSWRDSAGKLWTKNMLAPINIPHLEINNVSWLIAKVTFKLDSSGGTLAELTLMPPSAFSVEPVALYPSNADIIANLQTPPADSSTPALSTENINLSETDIPVSAPSTTNAGLLG